MRERDQVTEGDALPVNLLIAKQRNGPTGEVRLTFLKFDHAVRERGQGKCRRHAG
jgi:replicative DNA helicase